MNKDQKIVEHARIMRELKGHHDVVVDLIAGSNVHYLDIPVHGNVGDLLIMLGTIKFLEANNIKVSQVAAHYNIRESIIKDGDVILFHGGGNFGDLYKNYQETRERIIQKFKNNRIIILPQTIFFSNELAYKKCKNILIEHKNLFIFCRDDNSYKIAGDLMDGRGVYSAPDMAHNLWGFLGDPCNIEFSNEKVLIISRVDDEKSDKKIKINSKNQIETDWPLIVGRWEYLISAFRKVGKIMGAVNAPGFLYDMYANAWINFSKKLVEMVIKDYYKNCSGIVTDRLHGIILATILNVDVKFMDNSYGKNSSYYNKWLNGSPLVKSID